MFAQYVKLKRGIQSSGALDKFRSFLRVTKTTCIQYSSLTNSKNNANHLVACCTLEREELQRKTTQANFSAINNLTTRSLSYLKVQSFPMHILIVLTANLHTTVSTCQSDFSRSYTIRQLSLMPKKRKTAQQSLQQISRTKTLFKSDRLCIAL